MSESAPSAPAVPAAPSAAPAVPAASPGAVPPAPPAPPVPAAPAGEPQDVASLPAWAQTLITTTRAEAANWRTRAQGTAPQPGEPAAPPAPPAPPVAPVTPETPGAEGDVARLPQWAQRAVTDGQGAARQLAVQAAVIAAAPAAGADIARLLDSNSAMAQLAAVDPTNPAAVAAAITAALTAQPYLGTAGMPAGPARGGAEFGTPASTEVTPAQFAAMDYSARVALHQSDPATYRRLAG